MTLNERMILDRIGLGFYQKIGKMQTLAEFKTWVSTMTETGIKDFIKQILQEMLDKNTADSAGIRSVVDTIDS